MAVTENCTKEINFHFHCNFKMKRVIELFITNVNV